MAWTTTRWTRAGTVGAVAALALAACGGAHKEPPRAAYHPERDASALKGSQVAGGIVVDFKDGTTKEQFDAWEREWGVDLEFNSVEGPRSGITLAVGVPDVDAVLERIRQNPAVESAEPLTVYTLPPEAEASDADAAPRPGFRDDEGGFVPNDPDYARQWNLRMIHMPRAWEQSRGKGVIVAVLDTGVAYEDYQDFHRVPDLRTTRFAKGYDFVNDDTHADDDHGHGTHVAGTIAQSTNNGEGVAGVAFDATIMPVKVLNHFGAGTSADIADAIRFAADNGAKVINLSLGGGWHSAAVANAVDFARKKGATVVAAAGNGSRAHVEFPAAYPGVIGVSAVDPEGKLAFYSSWGPEVDLAAPGGDKRAGPHGGILQNTVDPRDPSKSIYAAYQGTSMATPHVSGVAALLYAAGAETPEQVEQALYAGAQKVEGGDAERYGHGLLDAQGALAALRQQAPPTAWQPLAWSAALLALVLLTLGGRERPGYFNILLRPTFLLPLLLATVGVFFLRNHVSGDTVSTLTLPMPDWQRIIFGRGKLANPLFYSSLLPLVASLLAIRLRGLRPVVGGLALGFAGFLAYAAWSRAPGLAYLPFAFLAVPWLVLNTLSCVFIARAMLKREAA
ncbi:S8 family serine peptidase [Aggregicoccus sp. 17bor-14]|uniref:S8 family peptidase n=1 Tax=Myxococcaceae TaxID=31 RepID=UPI00129C6346|nr:MULTISPECIES: S8 family peptidase [Myxococcaceae]MBF5041063.1 S8 family serine peptidase [Simulacricoccus sp. 17bor-14]MRI86849.1 S8 family serine peptidase [Aggregicoccus sp. 17bor-14]